MYGVDLDPNAEYHLDNQGDMWMKLRTQKLPDDEDQFVIVAYRYGKLRVVSERPASEHSIRQWTGAVFMQRMAYAEAAVTLLLNVIERFERTLREGNLL